MTTIYIITEGAYSDYGIVTVFSTREMADKYVEMQGADWDGQVEEYELDVYEPQVRKGDLFYRVIMQKDGSSKVEQLGFGDPETDLYPEYERYLRTGKVYLTVLTWARDEQHAAKIANEKRAAVIASGEWERAEQKIREGRTWRYKIDG